jgi:hypothetical protein
MKSEVFNGSRFWTYFKYDLTQMWRNHVKAAILIGFSGLILYVLGVGFNAVFDKVWQAPSFGARLVIFFLACFALELYQTRTYGYLTDRRKGAAWLVVPASSFEKWLSMIIMTLVVIPVAFLGTYALIDGLLALADPTYGEVLIGAAKTAIVETQEKLAIANEEYSTTWNLGFMVLPAIAGFVCNFLYFLLCGICFKKNKILWAFIILFGASIVLSTVMTTFGLQTHYDIEDLSEAEEVARHIIRWTTAGTFALAACFAGGIFYRIKTLKH